LLEKVARMNLLFDFYGQLLTNRQKVFMELYYAQDFSLGEIAREYQVTRQAVYDTLKRAEQTLFHYEDKLGLVAKFNSDKDKLSTVASLLDESGAAARDSKVRQAKEIIDGILNI